MYLSTGTLIAVMIALTSSSLALAYALYQNKELLKHNNWLVQRNRDLNHKIQNMVEVPF